VNCNDSVLRGHDRDLGRRPVLPSDPAIRSRVARQDGCRDDPPSHQGLLVVVTDCGFPVTDLPCELTHGNHKRCRAGGRDGGGPLAQRGGRLRPHLRLIGTARATGAGC